MGVETRADGSVVIDRRLRTSGDRIYAAGDVAGELQFTHVAGHDAATALANGLFRTRRKIDRQATPWVIFTDPEVARVGLTEAEAREEGHPVDVVRYDLARLDRAITSGGTGFARLVVGRLGRQGRGDREHDPSLPDLRRVRREGGGGAPSPRS